jgi:hypothetical protein
MKYFPLVPSKEYILECGKNFCYDKDLKRCIALD